MGSLLGAAGKNAAVLPNQASAVFSGIMANAAGMASKNYDTAASRQYSYTKVEKISIRVSKTASSQPEAKNVVSSGNDSAQKQIEAGQKLSSEIKTEDAQANPKVDQATADSISEEETVVSEEDTSVISKKMEQILSELIGSIVKEDLGVTDEELAKALEFMGISELDLLNPETLKDFTLYLYGAEDISEILMDDGLSTMFTKVMEDLSPENLSKESDIPEGDLNQVIQNVLEQPEGLERHPVVFQSEEPLENIPQQEMAGAVNKNPEDIDAQSKETVSKQESLPEVTVVKQGSDKGETGSFQNHANGQEQQMDLAETMVNNISTSVTQSVASDGSVMQTVVQMRQIVVQVVQQIRVIIRPEQTNMQMVLHPENLGRIHLSMTAAKDGMMTANFVVQNEMVRQALESQMQELKDAFNQQGLRVESVEVTVAAFEFNQGEQAENSQEQQNGQKKNHTGITMEEAFAEELEEDEDPEMAAAAAISGTGNHVNYTA